MRRSKALERTAYHEAGHAVVHLDQEIPVEHLTIIPDQEGTWLGMCRSAGEALAAAEEQHGVIGGLEHAQAAMATVGSLTAEERLTAVAESGRLHDLYYRDLLERHCLGALAGVLAEARFSGRHNWSGAAHDMRSVGLMFENSEALNLHPDEHQPYLHWLMARTRVILNRRWRQVEAVAEALLRDRELALEQLETAIQAGSDRMLRDLKERDPEAERRQFEAEQRALKERYFRELGLLAPAEAVSA